MIGEAKVLALIPARGGSKGVPRKNIVDVAGKPLIAYTIDAAARSKYIDRIVISTDDRDILDVAVACGAEAPFVRPAELARDDTPGVAPVLHAVQELPGYDYVVLLQPTSPLRSVEDIDRCIELAVERQADHCVSVVETDKSPFWMYALSDQGGMTPLLEPSDVPRQKLPKTYVLNGAVYVSRIETLVRLGSFLKGKVFGYAMPKSRSLDIDTPEDVEYLHWTLTRTTADS
ncbi:acylneuraminate cytidylyltransferase family protein [Paenibacillus antri]|uniref:Acylneuraminate cytidylyltransferase family protein n=1 Tax=Paenibacillus antri TaxID=2582848 RepID=A0A5R9GBS4_9BACL|nr:acylneuraminate cytidylyltransferase family protein [Paenibacillus antri]TLS50574.1 acylneuraminate cytidylyltransferase family protein [Paenibacillus antri]